MECFRHCRKVYTDPASPSFDFVRRFKPRLDCYNTDVAGVKRVTRSGDAPRTQCQCRKLRAVARRCHRAMTCTASETRLRRRRAWLVVATTAQQLSRRRVAASASVAPVRPRRSDSAGSIIQRRFHFPGCESECGESAAAAGDWSSIRVLLGLQPHL
ncbi:hypothetical protein CONLIGDRAFT_168618 [Coniochaeta ligniaria NRRL 30616]|uniref:Uncharacterized protein n=1 Tax=Coniochaeta ligniaria NRRL 30616 TaxID=1408157 RepID=A0A1J7IZU9_9PEZI|nr:hypothetical protein CONLIGDRAFT_168618 [Coniochaeta ligniaria NRRL 30616]